MSEEQYQSQEENQDQINHENEMNEKIIIGQEQDNSRPLTKDLSTKKIKDGHEIISEEENKIYFLKFRPLGSNLKILLSEQDTFPAKSYEIYLALEELKLKNPLFSKFSSTKQLSEELNRIDSKNNFILKKKKGNIMGLTIIFPNEGENENIDNDIEIDLTENLIDDREMFRQLFEKYKSIQKEQNEDINEFNHRIKKIEEVLTSHNEEQEKNKNEDPLEQNENENEQKSEVKGQEENVEEHKEIQPEPLEVKSSNKGSMNSIQKDKNAKKGKFEKRKEDKSKIIKKKKK